MKRTIAICGNRYQQGHLRLLARLLRLLADRDFTTAIQTDFFQYLTDAGVQMPDGTLCTDTPPSAAEAIISVGGDGTFLRAAAWAATAGIPVLGINTGNLGYLAYFSLDDMDSVADSLRDRSLKVQSRMLLSLDIPGGSPCSPALYALNEIAILKDETSSMIDVETRLDGMFLADYRADGLIISTATGSTGYNMSAGGPLLQPDVDATVITPVAPHSLTLRPLIISGKSAIWARTMSRAGRFRVSVDGNSFTLPAGSEIVISRASHRLNVLMPADANFAATLRSKLNWAKN